MDPATMTTRALYAEQQALEHQLEEIERLVCARTLSDEEADIEVTRDPAWRFRWQRWQRIEHELNRRADHGCLLGF